MREKATILLPTTALLRTIIVLFVLLTYLFNVNTLVWWYSQLCKIVSAHLHYTYTKLLAKTINNPTDRSYLDTVAKFFGSHVAKRWWK